MESSEFRSVIRKDRHLDDAASLSGSGDCSVGAAGVDAGAVALSQRSDEEPELRTIGGLKRRIVADSVWAFSGRVLTVALTLAVNALVARLLTPPEVGTYFLLFRLVTVLVVLAQLGVRGPIVRWVAEAIAGARQWQVRAVVRKSLLVAATGLLTVAVVLATAGGEFVGIVVFSSPRLAEVMPFAALWLLTLGIQYVVPEVFRGLEDIPRATLYGGVITGTFTVGLLGWLWLQEGTSDLQTVLLVSLMAGGVNAVVVFLVLKRRLARFPSGGHMSSRDLLRVSIPFVTTNMAIIAVYQVDLLMLGMFRPDEEVAFYGAAQRLVLVVGISMQVLVAVVAPITARLYSQGSMRLLQRILRAAATVAALPAIGILAFFMVFADQTLGVVFGTPYSEASGVLRILCLGQLVAVCVGPAQLALLMTGYQVPVMKLTMAVGILNVGGILGCVHTYGSHGVAIVTTVSIAFLSISTLWQARSFLGIWTHVGVREMFRSYRNLMEVLGKH